MKHSGQLTVVRILDGTFSPAEASVATSGSTVGSTFASGSYSFTKNPTGSLDAGGADEFRLGDVSFVFVSSSAGLEDSTTQRFVNFGTVAIGTTLDISPTAWDNSAAAAGDIIFIYKGRK